MTAKREKYPPLKQWQLEVVKSHETRRRLLNGTPYDQAKYLFMTFNRIDEETFDADRKRYEETAEFKRLHLGRKFAAALMGLADSVGRLFRGRQA